jgi:hypothetical protein
MKEKRETISSVQYSSGYHYLVYSYLHPHNLSLVPLFPSFYLALSTFQDSVGVGEVPSPFLKTLVV